jgi:hypothetical protein
MKIKILRSKPLKEVEDEVIDQQLDVTTAPAPQELTYESNPLEFILQKYPSLQETLVKLLTADFRDYISGVYIMAPKPTIFKIVLHNNRYFYLTYMGKCYEAKVSGKKFWLLKVSELEVATIEISNLLVMGAPPQAEGPETELASTPDETDENAPNPEATPAEEEAPEELAESKKLGIRLIKENIVSDLKKLGYKDEDIIPLTKSGDKVKLLVPAKERQATLDKFIKLPGYKWDRDYKGSSIGAIITKDKGVIIPKPKEKQGGGSAGLGNESFLANKINSTVEEVGSPINIVVKGDNGKSIKFNNVDKAEEAGRDTSGNKKSDIRLLSNGKVVGNLSLKQENAVMWESADKRYKDLIIKLVDKLLKKPYKNLGLTKSNKKDIYRLYNPSTNQEYSGIIITDLNNNDMDSIVFGSDKPQPVVDKDTFDESDFTLKGKILTISVDNLATSLEDIIGTKYEPILVVRHDSTRSATAGLRPIVYTKESVYKGDKISGNRIELSYNKI